MQPVSAAGKEDGEAIALVALAWNQQLGPNLRQPPGVFPKLNRNDPAPADLIFFVRWGDADSSLRLRYAAPTRLTLRRSLAVHFHWCWWRIFSFVFEDALTLIISSQFQVDVSPISITGHQLCFEGKFRPSAFNQGTANSEPSSCSDARAAIALLGLASVCTAPDWRKHKKSGNGAGVKLYSDSVYLYR